MEENQSAYYGQYYIPLQNLEQEILQWLRKLVDAYAEQAGETPVEHIRSRIKTAEGMQEKLHKKGFETTADSALANVSDIVGFRLVTHFVGEVYDIVERMKQDGAFRVVKEKDYIANPKPNGYRSYHVILECPFSEAESGTIRVEVQLRTIAMDCWASLEHEMKYKKHIDNVELIERELKRCAGEMASTDLTMQTLRDMIQRLVCTDIVQRQVCTDIVQRQVCMAVAQRQVCMAVAQRQECMVITQRLAYMIYLHGNLCRNEDKDMSTKGKILYAEDELGLSMAVTEILKMEGFEVTAVMDGLAADEVLQKEHFDIAILDIMMPGMEGTEVARNMRDREDYTPVLLLTAKAETEDRIEGLNMGADDYLAKPFAMGELVARVKAMVRRNKEYQQTVLNLANVTLDLESNELSAKSGSLILSVKEAKLLALFLEKENVSYSKEEIVKRVFPGEVDTEEIALYIAYINNKLVQIHGNLQLVQEEEIIQLRKTA